MKKRAVVKEIMNTELKSISLHDGSVQEAKNIMEKHNIRHLPVTNGDKLEGIISLTDIKRVSFGANYGQEETVDKAIFNSLDLAQVMAHGLTTITAETTIKEAAEILSSNEFHALPVVEGDKIEGIVTTTDLITYLLEQY
ncbi:MAG: CBS domain-containing protein [Flavobacteriales bacterium]